MFMVVVLGVLWVIQTGFFVVRGYFLNVNKIDMGERDA